MTDDRAQRDLLDIALAATDELVRCLRSSQYDVRCAALAAQAALHDARRNLPRPTAGP